MASPVAVLDILVRANTGGASAQLTTLDRQLKGTAATATTTGAAIGKRLATAAKYGALGLAGLGAVSVKMAIDFDRSMRNVNSIAQLNEKQFDKLGERVRSLAGKTAQAPETLAEGLYDLVSSGFDANESMKVLKASANAATAGLTDTATSTKAVAATLNAYRMPAQKAGKVSDILFRTVDRGVISFDELAGTIGNVLPAATTLGVKLPEVGAAISTLTKEGQSGATAVTNINAAMTALFKPSEAMKAALQSIGYESAQALVQAKGFEGALKTLIASTDGSAESIGALFANVRAQRAVFGLTGKNAEAAAADLRGLQDSAGATQRALDEQSKSVAFMWNRLKAQASSLAIGIGDELLPKIKEFLEILTNPKLTLSEKVAKLGTKLTKTIEEWGPKLAKAGAVVGFAIVKGIWGAFWDSDLLGKLFIGAAALRLFGGPGVFRALGAKMGRSLGIGMAPTMASSTIAASTTGAAASKWKAFGTRIGKWIGPAASAALVLDIVWPDIDNQGGGLKGFINNIGRTAFTPFSPFPDKVDVSSREEFAHMLEEEFGKAAGSVKFQGKDRLRVATELGTLIFSAQTQKVVATNTKRLKDLLGKSMGQADRAIEVRSNTQERAAQEFDRLTGRYKHLYGSIAVAAVNMSDKQDKAYREAAKAAVQSGAITRKQYDRLIDKLDNAGDATKQMWRQAADVTGEKTKQIKANVGDMTVKVSKSYDNMVRVTGSGIDWLMKNTGDAMKALGLKQELKWNLQRHKTGPTGGGYGNQSRMHGGLVGFDKGAIVGGTGSGDKVPLHIGGQLSAMVEPGELVSVTNRTATAAQMALNKRIPRRQDGGLVPHLAKGGMPAMLALANAFDRANEPYVWGGGHGGFLTSPTGVDCSGAVSAILHAGGLLQGAPMVSGALMNWGKPASGSEPLVVYANPHHTVMSLNGRTFGTSNSNPNDGAGWIGASGASLAPGAKRTMDVAGAVAAHIARVLLKGPNGPLKDLGQKALDKTRSAANRFLASKMPSGTAGGGDVGLTSLPAALKKYDHRYPSAMFPSEAWNNLYQMPFNAVAALAEWRGTPGVTMAQVSEGEGNLRPGSRSSDNGWGLWGITSPFADGYGVGDFGGYKGMLNPVANAIVMGRMYPKGWSGGSPWYGTSHVTGYNQHYKGSLLRKYGGIVPHLAKGGKPGKAGFKPGPTDPAYKRFVKAQRFADKLKGLIGDRGKIARLDERIQIAETMAGLDSSELGSDLGPNERQKQIRLNEALLARMVMARKLARTGLGWLDFPKGMSTAAIKPSQLKGLKGRFTQTLLDLTGLTGRSGRIFDTRMQLDALKHTSTTGAAAEALDISGLRAMLEAARYGVFDGYYAKGGTIGRGKWGVVGENGPEIVHGPATVTPSPQVTVENNFDWEGMDLYVTTTVDGQIAKREKLSRRRARQMVR